MMKKYLMLAAIVAVAGCASMKTDFVRIDAEGSTELNGKPIAVSEISDHLKRDSLLIRADKATPYNNVIAVMSEAKEAGVANVSLATDSGK